MGTYTGKVNHRQLRQEKALDRESLRSTRTPQEQLKRLDELLGVGVGAVKERARLARLIEQKAKRVESTEEVEEVSTASVDELAAEEPNRKAGKGKKNKNDKNNR